MNKVITINLGGTAYQLEEAGYEALRAYLDTAAARLQGNPDRDEIISDIEQAIGEKFRALLGNGKTVVTAKEVAAVVTAMGPIENDPGAPDEKQTASENRGAAHTADAGAKNRVGGTRRLYRIEEGAMLSGVCNGLAAYLNLDPTFVRLGFVLLTVFWGAGLLVYCAMAIIVPTATSPDEKAAAYGAPSTAQEFIRRARDGYYDAMKSWPDRQARREWKRRFKREMRGWRTSFHYGSAAYAPPGFSGPCSPMRPSAALPLFSLLHGAIKLVWLCALVSVLATGGIFGVALPTGVPVWLGLILLMLIFGFVSWPLKIARRSMYYRASGAGGAGPVIFVGVALVGVAV